MNSSQEKKSGKLSSILGLILLGLVFYSIISQFSSCIAGNQDNEYIHSAEGLVNQQVYRLLGVACQKYDSEIIFREEGPDGKEECLVAVNFYIDAKESEPFGSFCVYCMNGNAYNCTNMQNADYPYKDYLDELRAMFGFGI